MDHSLIDKSIMDLETMEVIASGYLTDRKTPIIRIKITPDEPLTDAGLNIGDNVTVTDAEANISGDYRIVGLEYTSNYGLLSLEIEVSNASLEFVEQMSKSKQDAEDMQKYMQGSTNIYSISEAENCDASNYLNMRFFIPNEAVAINKVNLNFKLKDYRAYHIANETESTHTHNIIVSNEPGAGSVAAVGVLNNNLYSAWGATGGVPVSAAGSAHVHGITFGITESALLDPSVVLYVGTDGGDMTSMSTYTTSAIEVDITDQVKNVGSGNWANIQFRPNKNMRIEANAYCQIFLESK